VTLQALTPSAASSRKTLPNQGRNPFTVNKLDNNVTPVGDLRFVRYEGQNGTDSQPVAGAPIGTNGYVVDGIPISISTGGVIFVNAIEAVSDVKVQANTNDSELGRAGGGVFNTSLKSGTTTYHGELFGFEYDNRHVREVVDRTTSPKKNWVLEWQVQGKSLARDYAVVARIRDKVTGEPVILLAGILGEGTEAASEVVSNPAYLDAVLQKAPKNWEKLNLEAVIGANVIEGHPGPPTVVAVRTW
jgi:hypothetical protein